MQARQAPAKRQRVWGVRLVNDALVTRAEGPNKHKFGEKDIKLDEGPRALRAILENLLVLDKRRREESQDMCKMIKQLQQEVRNPFAP
jgi:hypothetical protein